MKKLLAALFISLFALFSLACDIADYGRNEDCRNKYHLCLWNCAEAFPSDQTSFLVCIKICEDREEDCQIKALD